MIQFLAMRLAVITILLVASTLMKASGKQDIDSLHRVLQNTHEVKEKIKVYFDLSKAYKQIDLDSSRFYVEQSLNLSKKIERKEDIAEAYACLGDLSVPQDSLNRAIYEYKTSLELFEQIQDYKNIASIQLQLGNLYLVMGNHTQAMDFYMQALRVSEKHVMLENIPHINNNIGIIYYEKGEFEEALNYYIPALEIFEEEGDSLNIAISNTNVGLIYNRLDNTALAQTYFKKSRQINKLRDDKIGILQGNNFLSDNFLENGQADSALRYLEESYSIIQNLGLDYPRPKSVELVNIYYKKGRVYHYNRDWSQAIEYFRRSYQMALKTKQNHFVMHNSKMLSDIYDSLDISDSSFKYFKYYKYYSDSIINEENIKKLAQLEVTYQYEQEISKQKLLTEINQAKLRRRNLVFISIGVGLLLLLILTYLLLQLEKNKKAKLDLEHKHMLKQLEDKNKEITTRVLYLLKKNEFILSVSEKLRNIIPDIKVKNKKSIAKVIRELEAGSSDDAWKEFEVSFQEVHTDFFKRLNSDFHDLTPNEIRLCAFLRLNMSTKDIASITYQSERSIVVARSRLRKKLGMETDESLVSFLTKY